jgi:hypothetical protein
MGVAASAAGVWTGASGGEGGAMDDGADVGDGGLLSVAVGNGRVPDAARRRMRSGRGAAEDGAGGADVVAVGGAAGSGTCEAGRGVAGVEVFVAGDLTPFKNPLRGEPAAQRLRPPG